MANLFRQQIGAFLPQAIHNLFSFRAKRRADREDHTQQTETTLLESKLKAEEFSSLRKAWREEQWVELIQKKDAWIQEELDDRLKEQSVVLGKISELMHDVRANGLQTNELLTTMNSSLARMAEKNKL